MKASSNAHLRRTLLCALVAGGIAAPFAVPHAYALPIEGANAATNKTEADISTSGAVMDITGKTEHNVLRWEDFSVDSGEKVRFDNGTQTKDYLNLVTGEGASNIYGTIEGGRNVYLVNPHGILFAAGSQVNTGALYLSTANVDAVASAAGTSWGGNSPLTADTQYGNVLNLGTVKASKLYIEGNNVTVLNTDAVKDANGTPLTGANVTIRSTQTPHIGYDVGNTARANFNEGGGSMWRTFYNYKYPNTAKSASGRGWDVANLGGTAHTDYDYMRVHTVYDLQNINAKRDGRYILAGDIDATATTHWNSGAGFAPLGDVGNKFTGRLDGAGHTLRGLYINRQNTYSIGLFGYADGARIENLSLVDGYVEGDEAVGGIVGYADGTEIRNVSYAGSVVGNQKVGGIAGDVSGGSIQNAWNAGTVSVRSQFLAGGIVGRAMNNAVIQNVCNTGAITGSKLVGGIVGAIDDSTLQHAWNTGTVTGNQKVGGIVGQALGGSIRHAVWKSGSAGQAVGESNNGADVTTDVKVAPEAQMKLAATYTDWKDANGNAIVATEGGKGTPWRIYEGHTMPLLTALMKGTKRLEKVYDGNVFATTDPHITLVHTGKDVGTYDAYSDQFGYNLIGGAIIKPKQLNLALASGARFDKTYDGTANVTQSLTKDRNYTLTNFVNGEGADIALAPVTGTYTDKNAGTGKTVTFGGLTLTGTGAGNYTLDKTTLTGMGTITPKQLNLALMGGARFDKTYDGNANVTQTLTKGTNYTLTNFADGEGADIALAPVTGTYTDKNAGTGKAVTFGGLTLTGTGVGNYVLNRTSLAGIGTISRCALTLGAVAAQSKTYDGNTLADASKFGAVLNNVVAGDSVTATATGAAYNDKNVTAANRIDYTGVALAGADAGNYSLAATAAQGTGSITHRDLTLTADAQSIVQGEALPSFTGRAEGFADGEDERVFGTDGITFGTTLTNTDTPGSYGIMGRIGSTSDGVLGNYRIGQAAGNATAFTIHAAALPGGILAALVQDAVPRFDMGFGQEVYVFGLPRPIPTATLGIYRFAPARDLLIEGVRLD